MVTQALAVNGAKVYITGRTSDKLEHVAELYSKNISGQIIPVPADVTSKESIQKLVDTISEKESKLHILINNAGIGSKTHSTEYTDPKAIQEELFRNGSSIEEWEGVMRTNVLHLFFTTTAFLPLLTKGSEDHAQHHFAYSTSKAAAIHLTKMLAHEIISSGLKIRVNNIAPGVFPSLLTTGSCDESHKSSIPKEKFEEKVPAKRPGKDEDMASAVLFTTANQYLNGQTIVVDGGYLLKLGSI